MVLSILWGLLIIFFKWVLPPIIFIIVVCCQPSLLGKCFSQAITLIAQAVKRKPGSPILKVFTIRAIDVWNLSIEGVEVSMEEGAKSYHIIIAKWQIRTAVKKSLKTFFSTVKPFQIRVTGARITYISRGM